MWRPIFVFAILVLLLAPGLASPPPAHAHACSAGPDWDPVAEADLIIVGRVVSMRLAPEYESFGPVPEAEPVWLDFEIDRYLKGSGPHDLSALDTASVVFLDGQTDEQKAEFESAMYWGSGGACGALNADPRGQYWITGLTLDEGVYRTNLLLLIGAGAIGTGPDDPAIVERIEEIEDRVDAAGPTPAATGHGVTLEEDRQVLDALGLLAAAVIAIAARYSSRMSVPGRPAPRPVGYGKPDEQD